MSVDANEQWAAAQSLIILGAVVGILVVAMISSIYKLILLPDYYFAWRRANVFWQRWLVIAQQLIEMGLVKPSQVSNTLRKKYLAAASERVTRSFNEKLAREYQNQDQFHIDGTQLPSTLPRTKQAFEEKQDLVTTTLNDQLLPPLTNIIDSYSTLPVKLNLCVDDLEYYFLHSELIELKFSQQFENEHKLNIFYRGDSLLLTVPTQFVKAHCAHPHRQANCVCGSTFTLVPDIQDDERSQLQKNIDFISSSSWMPASLISSRLSVGLGFPRIEIDDILPWTAQLQRESKFVTIEFTSVGLSISGNENPITPTYACPHLKFVGVEMI